VTDGKRRVKGFRGLVRSTSGREHPDTPRMPHDGYAPLRDQWQNQPETCRVGGRSQVPTSCAPVMTCSMLIDAMPSLIGMKLLEGPGRFMNNRWSQKVACPNCGAEGQRFSMLSSAMRRSKLTCKHCGHVLESQLGPGTYFAYMLYVNFVLFMLAVPLVLAMASQRWALAAAMLGIFLLCVFPAGLILHARNSGK
jgi:hypothetical protein